MTSDLIPMERIAKAILNIRGQRAILDSDLAALYGVSTKVLNQAVKRNIERFPPDFMFSLTPTEKTEVVTNCDHLSRLRFSPTLPNAFTEHGATPPRIPRTSRGMSDRFSPYRFPESAFLNRPTSTSPATATVSPLQGPVANGRWCELESCASCRTGDFGPCHSNEKRVFQLSRGRADSVMNFARFH